MTEYIERDAALEVAIGWREQLIPTYGENDEYVKCLETVAEHLYDIPAADVAPVVHAKWIGVALGDARCSNCGEVYGVCGGLMGDYNFCPNCGAKMEVQGEV